jgi:Fe-S cluster biogenesis protein NfuA
VDAVRTQFRAHVTRFIHAHAGDVDVVSVSQEGDVQVRFFGACTGCPAIGTTFAGRVLPAIEAMPGVRRVSAEGVYLSAAALDRIKRLRTTPRQSDQRSLPATGTRS